MAATGLVSLAERGAGEHGCMGAEAEDEEGEEQNNEDNGCYTLDKKDLVFRSGLVGWEDVHYGWQGEEDEDDHHEGREDCCEGAIKSESFLVIA